MEPDKKKRAGSRKQITFDLSQKALEMYYPRPKATTNPKFYKKAYMDISHFYTSKERITNTDITLFMADLAKEMPWLSKCVNQIDVTNIGNQHSLLQILEEATLDLDIDLEKM